MYAGNVGDLQGLETAICAISDLSDRPDIHLRIIGEGLARPKLEALALRLQVEARVHFEGTRDASEMAKEMASAQVNLVPLRPPAVPPHDA